MDPKIIKAKSFIHSNINTVKTLDEVSQGLCISSETLRKTFVREESVPLSEYLLLCKIRFMQEQLLITHEPCYVVCYNAGLREDTGAKIFKKYCGVTMQQFREKYQKEYELLRDEPSKKVRLAELLTEAFTIKKYSKYIFGFENAGKSETTPPVHQNEVQAETKTNQTKPNQTTCLTKRSAGRSQTKNSLLEKENVVLSNTTILFTSIANRLSQPVIAIEFR